VKRFWLLEAPVKHYRLGLLMLLGFASGCGSPPYASVEGVVTLDGKPLADVESRG
jgi:hypothetical protein